jgi:integrase
VQLIFFDGRGWESWGIEHKPTVPDGMPVLVDDDLLFEDGHGVRPAAAVNQWLRELPCSGAPAPGTWAVYARVLRDWMEFLSGRGVPVFGSRDQLRSGLGAYAVHRSAGPVSARYEASTWNQHVSILSGFYRWAVAEGHAVAEPFTYKQAVSRFGDQVREQEVNQAVRRRPKAHVTIRYLEADYTAMFLRALAGLMPDGSEDLGYRGRELARNAAVGGLAFATGLRAQEFTFLLAAEVPPLPAAPASLPIPFPVPAGIAKGRKFRTTWISYEALAEVHRYLGLHRPLAAAGSAWRPPPGRGEPLQVSEADARGGRVNGRRVSWGSLRPAERLRLVAPGGGSMLVAVRADGGPFTAWASVFARTADRIRDRFDPRFPHVHPHRARHSFAIATLERLVGGYYQQAAKLVQDTGADAGLALYLSRSDPLMVLRDLLGHSSAVTTEAYLRRLDMTRVYREAYEKSGAEHGLLDREAALREADEEFDEEDEQDDGLAEG